MTQINEEMLASLREAVRARQSEKRFRHTCGVEEEAAYLGHFYLPHQIKELRAAAILHDLTKCIPDEDQIPLCERMGIPLTEIDRMTPQTLHGKTAEKIIMTDFPAFASPEILQAVRVHTTGNAQMTTFDKIIFLSDYIEAGRPYPDCKRMREKFHAVCENADIKDLDETLCEVFQLTLRFLEKNKLPISPGTLEAYLALSGEKQ